MTTTPMTLYTWWRSQASFRVRIALHLKGLKAEMVFIDLSKDDHLTAPYRLVNPEMVLPTLIDGEGPPLRQSLAILKYLEEKLGLDDEIRMEWLQHWLDSGTRTIENMLSNDPRTGRFCCGDAPTIADICLVPHLTSAMMLYGCDLEPYPTVRKIFEACMQIDAFTLAHPLQQADASKLR